MVRELLVDTAITLFAASWDSKTCLNFPFSYYLALTLPQMKFKHDFFFTMTNHKKNMDIIRDEKRDVESTILPVSSSPPFNKIKYYRRTAIVK